ncbi:MAG: histidine kinase, partial [Acidobacteria bacterium]|nr:histidine kinase [Acidobacteriota bacterium]
VQEGLTNILRHAGAHRVVIRTAVTAQSISLVLEDDGKGFDVRAPRPAQDGIGLTSIRQRVRSLGGVFQIESAPGEGTRLSVSLPLAP